MVCGVHATFQSRGLGLHAACAPAEIAKKLLSDVPASSYREDLYQWSARGKEHLLETLPTAASIKKPRKARKITQDTAAWYSFRDVEKTMV